MRLVRLSDLSEEKRKKALEEQQERLNKNKKEAQNIQSQANNDFNNYIQKHGAYNTNQNTTTIRDLQKVYKNTSSYNTVKNSLNNYYKENNKTSLWDDVKNLAEQNIYNNTANSMKMLNNNQISSKETINDKINNLIYGKFTNTKKENKNTLQKDNNKSNKIKSIEPTKYTNESMLFSEQSKQIVPIKEEKENKIEKNNSVWKDVKDLTGITGLGISTGSKQVLNYIESTNENKFDNYKTLKERQFITSKNVGEEEKAIAKSQNNLLLQKNGINTEQKVETNLVKRAIRDSIIKDEEEIAQKTDRISNKGIRKLADIAPSMGQMLPGIALNAVNPVLGTTYFTTSAGGGYIEDGLKRGMTEEQAWKYGTIMGALEGASDSFITGQQYNKVAKAFGGQQISKKVLDSYGFNMFENAVQEAVMEPAQEITAGIIGGKDKTDWSDMFSRMAESGFNGALMGAITNGVTYGLEKSGIVYNKIKNKEQVTTEEYKEALQENIDKFGKEAVQQNMEQGALETYQELSNAIDLQQNTTQNQINQQTQQITSAQNENASNLNMTTNNLKDNTTTKIAQENMQKATIKDFNESAKQYNIDYSNEDLQEINQMFNKRGIKAYFDENTFRNNNDAFSVWKPVTDEQGNISRREVVFNPNAKDSNTRVQELAIHELGHDLDLNEVQDMILKDASRKENWESARKSLENTYREAYKNDGINISEEDFNKIVDEEATMSILQRELGSQEYVNRLVNQNQSVAKKIYNWIIDKLNKFTGGKNEKIFWTDIKNKFETAYNQGFNKNGNNLKYSVGGKEGLKNIIDPNEKAEGLKNYKLAKQMAKKGKTNNEIFAKTGWFQDKVTGEMKFNFSDKDMDVISKNYNIGQEYTLKEILKHNTLFEMYPQLKEYTVIIEDMNANREKKTINGAYNRYTDVIKLDYRRFNQKADVEGTLIHEIQHAIQKIENFSRGASKVWGKKFYEKSPGEIEARDTSNRLMEEKYNGKDLKDVMPKSGNIEVSILDKMKIGLYNYLKDKKGGVEKSEDISKNQGKSTHDNSENNGLVLGRINKKLEERVSGDKLLDTQDFINEIKDVGAEIDENGYVTVYHQTTKDNANKIRRTGKMSAKEDGIFFSTSKNAQQSEGRGDIKLEFKIPAEKLELDDIFTSNADVKIPLKNKNQLLDVSDYLVISELKSENNSGSFNSQENKQKQLEIIQKNNKMQDDYHTGIRTVEDIKTLEETLQDSDWFGYDEFNPDYTRDMANEALKTGKITVYSSYPIKQGTFVSPSKMEAESYSGNGKVYSKEININDVAWIDPTQGQYANTNQKYALPTKEWQQFVEDNYQKQGTGKNLKEYNLPTKEDVKAKVNLPTKEKINQKDNQSTKGEKIDRNEIESPENRKIRKHYRSIIESNNTTKEAKAIAKELMGTDTYVPETNKGQLAQADTRINNSSPEVELKSLMSRSIAGEKISSVDIAVGERLIQYYSKMGDKTNLQEAIQATAMAGTSAGQTVQAFAILNHQTPQGQATWIQRSVDKMNNELAKKKGGTITKDNEGNIKVVNKRGQDITDKVNLFDLTPDMIDKIVNSKNKTEMFDNIDQVYEELGQQVPKSTIEKIDSWRYFSMLANPKTHIRNIVGNLAMGKTQRFKDKLAGGIEDIVSTFNKDMERTKTFRPADKKTKVFAKNDVLNPDVQTMMELNENKYNPQSRLQNARRTFKSDIMENTLGRLFDWNDNLLEAEDAMGLKSAYKKALTDYLTANKIDVDNITDKQLSKVRNYAVEQAKEATFHQANSIATAINQFSRKNGLTKGATDALLPFVKTPMNVAKAGIEYNPVGLLKTITYDTVKLRKGDITVNKYIDNLSKGLTGTGIAVLGYALADAGILKASGGDDDKKEKYDEALGKQTYSITIGDKTYSLDWLTPVGIPLFVGAEANALRNSQQKEKNRISSDDDKKYNQALKSLENLANAMSNSMSPMSEMSMISGLTSALSSYEKDKTSAVITNAVKSYVNQFVPTVLGQIARTTDDYERSTTSTKSGVLSKAIDQTKLQVMSKIPGLRQKLPTKADIWGNEQKSEPNLPLRVVNNFVNPATVKNINTSKVDEELDNLYNKTGESSILPSTIDKKYKINGTDYTMTNEEYAKYKKDYGQTSYKLLNDLINSSDYNKLSDDQKQKAIENVYSYAKEVNKVDYAKKNNETLETSTLYDTLEELKQKGGNQSSYLNYLAKTKDINGEDSSKKKIEVLANSNYTDRTKEIIYKNTEGDKDKKIIAVDKLGLPIDEYLKYKSQKFESDKDEDGETIKGSKNQKVYDYLNNISDKNLSQDYKKILCKMSGISSYDTDIIDIVNNNQKLTTNDRKEILTNIGFKIYEDGRIKTSSKLPIVKYVK